MSNLLKMKPVDRIGDRKQRWVDFMNMDKPSGNVFLIDVADSIPQQPHLWPDKKNERIGWILEKYYIQMEQVQWLRDDMVPFLDCITGTEIFAECFGCEVFRPLDNTPFARPVIHNAVEVSRLKKPKLEDTSLMLLFDIADELRKRAGNDAVLRIPDVQSPMDISTLIWDKNDFYMALIDEPEAVKELSGMVKQLLIEFFDEWFSRYGREYIAHFPDYYMTGGLTVSEDEIGAVSEEMFDEFFLPELTDLSNHFGGFGMHCCANAGHQWKSFKKIPGLRLLNLVQPREQIIKAYSFFADYVPQMHSWCGDGPAWTWVDQHPKEARVAIQVTAASRKEAMELSEKLWSACGMC